MNLNITFRVQSKNYQRIKKVQFWSIKKSFVLTAEVPSMKRGVLDVRYVMPDIIYFVGKNLVVARNLPVLLDL